MQFDDASKALVELAASRHNAFHSNEAAEINFTSRRLKRASERNELTRLHPRVWAITSLPRTDWQTLRAAVVSLPNGAAALQSAAWLHGWIEAPPKIPCVWVPATSNTRVAQISINRASRIEPGADITTVNEIRTLNKATTLCTLGASSHPRVVERCLDEFLRTESEAWLDDTMSRLWTPMSKGLRVLAEVRDRYRMTPGQTESWLEYVAAGLVTLHWLPSLELQHDVVTDAGKFRLDIAYPDLQLAIEVHSRSFHFGKGSEDADNVRDAHLSSHGWQLLYVTYSQLINPDKFVRQFARTARTRAAQLGVVL